MVGEHVVEQEAQPARRAEALVDERHRVGGVRGVRGSRRVSPPGRADRPRHRPGGAQRARCGRSAAAAAAAAARRGRTRRCRRRARRRSSSGRGTPAPGRRTRWSGSAGSETARSRSRRACRSSSRRGCPPAPSRRARWELQACAGSTRTTTTGEPRSSWSAPCGNAVRKPRFEDVGGEDRLALLVHEAPPALPRRAPQLLLEAGAERDDGDRDRGRQAPRRRRPRRREQPPARDALDARRAPLAHLAAPPRVARERALLDRGLLRHEPAPASASAAASSASATPSARPSSCVSGSRTNSAANASAAAEHEHSSSATSRSAHAGAPARRSDGSCSVPRAARRAGRRRARPRTARVALPDAAHALPPGCRRAVGVVAACARRAGARSAAAPRRPAARRPCPR